MLRQRGFPSVAIQDQSLGEGNKLKKILSTSALLGALFTAGAAFADPTVGASTGTFLAPLGQGDANTCNAQDVNTVSIALVETTDGCSSETDTGSATVAITYTLNANRYDLTLVNSLNGLLVDETGALNAQTYIGTKLAGTYTENFDISFTCVNQGTDPNVDVAAVFSWDQTESDFSLPTSPNPPTINEPKCTTDQFYPINGLGIAAMTLIKTATYEDTNLDGVASAGDTINYAFSIENIGAEDLDTITIEDTGATIEGSLASLAAGATNTDAFTGSYILTQADIDAGEYSNTATVTGFTSAGQEITDVSDDDGTNEDDPTVITFTQSGSLEVIKTGTWNDADADGIAEAGETIDYVFSVENTGNVTLTNVTIEDLGATVSGVAIASLAPGAVDDETFTATYTLDQDDINSGSYSNTATATGLMPDGLTEISDVSDDDGTNAADETVVELTAAPALTVTKVINLDDSSISVPAQAGDLITYDITVANTGNVTVEEIDVSDLINGGNACEADITEDIVADLVDPLGTSLAPGEDGVVQVTYTITDCDIDAGTIENLATAFGAGVDGTDLTVESSQFGNAVEGEGEGAPTPFVLPFLDLVKPDIKRILENDLRQTIQMQSRSFGRMSADALDTLKQGQDEDQACGTVSETGAVDIAEGAGAGNFGREYYDCVREERRIIQGELTVSKLDVLGTQIAGAFSDRRERFLSDSAVRGRFWGGYLSSTDVTDTATGKVNGIGLNGGIYGASELSEDAYLDYYLAAAIGRHSFDLTFANLDPTISVTGDYIYAAAFGGLGLSTEFDMGEVKAAPRLALDLAYAAAGDVKLAGERLTATEDGTLSLAAFQGARLMAELRFSDLDDADAADADKIKFDLAPRIFCDYGFEEASATQCGFGISADIETFDSADLTYGVMADYEQTDGYRRGTLSLNRTQYFDQGNGAIISTMGTTDEGSLMIGQSVDWKF